MSQGGGMVPLTNDIMGQMLVHVVEVMIECGLVQGGAEAEETAARAMQVLAAQGLIDSAGDVPIGTCLLLPGSSGRGSTRNVVGGSAAQSTAGGANVVPVDDPVLRHDVSQSVGVHKGDADVKLQ